MGRDTRLQDGHGTARYYVDHNATSPLWGPVRDRLIEVLDDTGRNPSSIHHEGQRARALVENARRQILGALGVRHGRVLFTSGATEANNLALRGWVSEGDVIASRLDHPSIRETVEELAGWRTVRWIPHDRAGRLDLAAFERILGGSPGMVALTMANNELGNIQPIYQVAAMCQERRVPFHVDAAQWFCRLPMQIPDGVTSVAVAAHKAGGPMGIGALWVADERKLRPISTGGKQERGKRPGTENLPSIVAFGELAAKFDPTRWQRLAEVRDALEQRLRAELGAVVHGDTSSRLPNTVNLSFPGRAAEEIVAALDLAGVSISAGSACSAGAVEASPILLALGVPADLARSAVRFSLGPEHRLEDVEPIVTRVRIALAAADASRPAAAAKGGAKPPSSEAAPTDEAPARPSVIETRPGHGDGTLLGVAPIAASDATPSAAAVPPSSSDPAPEPSASAAAPEPSSAAAANPGPKASPPPPVAGPAHVSAPFTILRSTDALDDLVDRTSVGWADPDNDEGQPSPATAARPATVGIPVAESPPARAGARTERRRASTIAPPPLGSKK